jgi:hypothetical protein
MNLEKVLPQVRLPQKERKKERRNVSKNIILIIYTQYVRLKGKNLKFKIENKKMDKLNFLHYYISSSITLMFKEIILIPI